MALSKETQREFLQITVGFLAAAPFLAGLRGVIVATPVDVARTFIDLDSHFVFMSGVLMAIGIAFWHCVRNIETKTVLFRALCGIVFLGGLCRLVSWSSIGTPSWFTFAGMGLEIIVAPALAFWQMRIAKLYGLKN